MNTGTLNFFCINLKHIKTFIFANPISDTLLAVDLEKTGQKNVFEMIALLPYVASLILEVSSDYSMIFRFDDYNEFKMITNAFPSFDFKVVD